MTRSTLVACAALFASLCGCKSAPSEAPAPEARASAPAPSASEPSEPEVFRDLRDVPRPIGERRVYDVKLESRAHVGDSPIADFILTGALETTSVQTTKESTLLYAALRPGATLTVKGAENAETLAEMQKQLLVPFLVELSSKGQLLAFHLTREPNALVIGIHQTLGAALQTALARGAQAEWVAEEQDATGRYRAKYVRSKDGGLSKEKLEYLDVKTSSGSARSGAAGNVRLAPEVVGSKAELTVDSNGVLESIRYDEKLSFASNRILPVQSETRLSLLGKPDDTTKVDDLPDWASLKTRTERYAADRPWSPPAESTEAVDRAKIAGRTLEQVLSELRLIAGETRPTDEQKARAFDERRADRIAALQALVRVKPGTVARLVEAVQKKDRLTPVLLDALGAAGTEEAQRALISLLEGDELDEQQAKTAAIALSRTPTPTKSSVQGLTRFLDHERLGTQALYGLGTSVRRLREQGHDEQASAALSVILSRLSGATTPMDRITALRAIANSGHEGAYTAVKPLLDSETEEVRAAAVESLQLMPLPEADARLAHHLAKDSASSVQLAAARAARLRKPSPSIEQAAVDTARGHDNPHVRLGALRVLTAWFRARPSLRGALEAIAKDDREDAIRREAKNALAGAAGSG